MVRDADPAAYAATARDVALVLVGLGDIDAAERFATEGLEIQMGLGLPGGIAHALFGVAEMEWSRGRLDRAINLMQESVARWSETENDVQRPSSLTTSAVPSDVPV